MSSSQTSNSVLYQKRWLSLIGVGEEGVQGLTEQAVALIKKADIVFGGQRHLELLKSLLMKETKPWSTPFDVMMKDVLAEKHRNVCILASGDPFFYGVGTTLCRLIDVHEMTVIPVPSSFSLAASRLGWALQHIDTVSLHGRPVQFLRPLLFDRRKILALTSGEKGPSEIAEYLTKYGFGSSKMIILEALGGSRERIQEVQARHFNFDGLDTLNLVGLELKVDADAPVLSCGTGLDDDLFEHDGQITKRSIRTLTLSSLAPKKGELLWDIGAGTGSVSIEWMLCHPSMQAVAIEHNPKKVERIKRNAFSLGVPNLEVVQGTAPEVLAELPKPDAIFIGGGGTSPGVLDYALNSLPVNGRLVVNAVTLEMEALLLRLYKQYGGELYRFEISMPSSAGTMEIWKPAYPITQWKWTKI